MIDTDKYEGHTEGEWDLHSMGDGWTIGQLRKIDRTLMQDAPLLLAEVKRLRKENDVLAEAIKEDNEILKKHIETLAELKQLRENLKRIRDTVFYDIEENFTDEQAYDPVLIEIMEKMKAVL